MLAPTYALQAITTKYLAPTNTKGARIKATSAGQSITIAWDYAKNAFDNHYIAARLLSVENGWIHGYDGEFRKHAFGALPDGGYVLAFVTT